MNIMANRIGTSPASVSLFNCDTTMSDAISITYLVKLHEVNQSPLHFIHFMNSKTNI